MKAQMDLQSGNRMLPKNGENKVLKAKAKDRDVSQEEMQSLLAKLKELVPNMPRNKKLSKLEIIQYVIDYIFDLQIALETQPPRSAAASLVAGSSSSRQPLGVLSPSANAVVNICGVQEASHTDKSPNHLGDIAITSPRPVSC